MAGTTIAVLASISVFNFKSAKLVQSQAKTTRCDSNVRCNKIQCLTKLIAELASNDCPVDYTSVLVNYEPLLHIYLIELQGTRKILRFGKRREFILANYDFYHDLPAQEWVSYLCGRKIACIKILEELLTSLLNEANQSHLE